MTHLKRIPSYSLILLTLFSCLLLQSGCGKKTPEQQTREEIQAATQVQNNAQDHYQKLTKQAGKDLAAKETVDWLKKRDDIVEAGVGAGCIWYKLNNGVTGLIQTDSMITK
jgi:hypothetical protein